jgi:Kae1-associated kinase Bud32
MAKKNNNKILGIGAEAIIIRNNSNTIEKNRISKSYRHPKLDLQLRKLRTRSEAKILQTMQRQNICVPKVISSNDNSMTINMSFIDGIKLRDKISNSNYKTLCIKLGQILAKMHNLNIIHSDLTTSNMIVKNDEIYLIDFGLSYFSHRTEDKAVDLHLLKQALDSYHYKIATQCFKIILTAYKKEIIDKQVILRLGIVEKRGKNKQ